MNNKRTVYINLPVKNLEKSVDFFTELGFTFDPRFTDQNAACMIISDNVSAMLLVEGSFSTFTRKQIADSGKSTEVIIAFSAGSREEVDQIVTLALAYGGKKSNDPIDNGWMYGWSFQDIDNHLWEVLYIDRNVLNDG